MEWLFEKKKNNKKLFTEFITYRTANWAAQGGHIHILEWLKRFDVLPSGAFYYPTISNHLETLQWLHENNIPKSHENELSDSEIISTTINTCMQKNNIKILKWIIETYHFDINDVQLTLVNKFLEKQKVI